jgi:hypothetical protein
MFNSLMEEQPICSMEDVGGCLPRQEGKKEVSMFLSLGGPAQQVKRIE